VPPDPDPINELRDRVRATQETAERLLRDVPSRGWEAAGEATPSLSQEVQALAQLLEAVRDLLPPELREQVAQLIRQLLLLIRAIIDFLVDRLERAPRGAEPEVEDIPIS
jgi:hypothetical protein